MLIYTLSAKNTQIKIVMMMWRIIRIFLYLLKFVYSVENKLCLKCKICNLRFFLIPGKKKIRWKSTLAVQYLQWECCVLVSTRQINDKSELKYFTNQCRVCRTPPAWSQCPPPCRLYNISNMRFLEILLKTIIALPWLEMMDLKKFGLSSRGW